MTVHRSANLLLAVHPANIVVLFEPGGTRERDGLSLRDFGYAAQ